MNSDDFERMVFWAVVQAAKDAKMLWLQRASCEAYYGWRWVHPVTGAPE